MKKESKSKFDIVNLGCGYNITTNEVVNKIIQHSGLERFIQNDITKPSIPAKFTLNIGKAMKDYNWKPTVSLDEGIMRTIGWYREFYGYQQNSF